MVKFLTPSNFRIAILGAGISGLTIAYELKKRFQGKISIAVFEKENRAGGWIRSENGFEFGPRSFRIPQSQALLKLVDELGLEDQLICASPKAKKRYILYKGKLRSASSFFLSKAPYFLRDLIVSSTAAADESIYDFFVRRFSKTAADYFADPLVKGIFAGNPKNLSMRNCFPKLWEMEKTSRSLILASLFQKKEKGEIGSFKGGMESLVSALVRQLKDDLFLNEKIDSLEFLADGVKVNGMAFDHVISTISAHHLSGLIPAISLPFSSLAVVHVGFYNQVNPFTGFGYLVPSVENERIMGVVFDSSVFPIEGHPFKTRLTVMLEKQNIDYEAVVKKSLYQHLKIQACPDYMKTTIANNAIPQYPVGYQPVKELPHLTLLGTSFHGVSVNEAINACQNRDKLFSKIQRVLNMKENLPI